MTSVFLGAISVAPSAPSLSHGYECSKSTYQIAGWHETKQENGETLKNEAGRSENRGLIPDQDQIISPLDKSWPALRPIHCTGLESAAVLDIGAVSVA